MIPIKPEELRKNTSDTILYDKCGCVYVNNVLQHQCKQMGEGGHPYPGGQTN